MHSPQQEIRVIFASMPSYFPIGHPALCSSNFNNAFPNSLSIPFSPPIVDRHDRQCIISSCLYFIYSSTWTDRISNLLDDSYSSIWISTVAPKNVEQMIWSASSRVQPPLSQCRPSCSCHQYQRMQSWAFQSNDSCRGADWRQPYRQNYCRSKIFTSLSPISSLSTAYLLTD